MKMMGLSGWLHWLAWFIKYGSFQVVAISFMTLFLHIPTPEGAVINYTDPSVTFVFLLIYSWSVVFFCFAVSVFFSKGKGRLTPYKALSQPVMK